MKNNSKLFQEISDVQKKSSLLNALVGDRNEIIARTNKKVEFVVRAQNWSPPFRLEVKSIHEQVKLGLEGLIVQFDHRGERYFSKVELAFDDWKLFFVFVNPVYRLQRRQHRRFKIPRKMKTQAFLMRANEQLRNEQCELIDISEGGCSLRLSYDALEIPHQAITLLDLRLAKFESFMQIGRVRYKRAEKNNGRSVVRMGIEFQNNKKTEEKLNKFINLLSMELFDDWNANN